MIILSILLFMIAAASNAVMDTLVHHYTTSVFWNKNATFWDPSISWKNKYVDSDPTKPQRSIPVAFTDAWHCFKSIMIVCLCATIALVGYIAHTATIELPWYCFVLMFCVSGCLWNVVFSLFYDRILRK